MNKLCIPITFQSTDLFSVLANLYEFVLPDSVANSRKKNERNRKKCVCVCVHVIVRDEEEERERERERENLNKSDV